MPVDTVNTINDLRSYVGSADLLIVKGYCSIGDGGGGTFYLDNGSSDQDDGGITIQSSAGLPGRWKRIFDGYVNIRWFGAKGNTLYTLDGATNAGSNILNSPGGQFTPADVGKAVGVYGAGSGGLPLLATITLYISPSQVQLSSPAGTTVSASPSMPVIVSYGTDDTNSIQKAIDYLQNHHSQLNDKTGVSDISGGFIGSSYTLYVPGGSSASILVGNPPNFTAAKYKITKTLELPDYLTIKGDRCAMLQCDNPSITILRIGGYYNIIEGIGFSGGLNHITFYGPGPHYGYLGLASAGSTVVIRDCVFRYPAGPCIYQDTSSYPDIPIAYTCRSSDSNLVVEDCDFQGACLLWGEFDSATFRNCFVTVDLSNPPFDDSGKPLAVWNSTGVLNMEDVVGVPNSGPPNQPNKYAQSSAWFQGTGVIHVTRMRFGGETTLTGIRVRTNSLPIYRGMCLPITSDVVQPCIYINESAIDSIAGLNWLEIYDVFPAVIDVRNPVPGSTTHPPTPVDCTTHPTITPSYDYMSIFGTLGVWVDADIPMSSIAAQNKTSILIHIEGFPMPDVGGGAFRFRQSSDPTSIEGEDLWPYLRQFLDTEPSPYANYLYSDSNIPQNNLYFAGVYDLDQHNVPSHTQMTGLAFGVDKDPSTGYPLTTYVRSPTPKGEGSLAIELGTTAFPKGWGDELPSGEYVFSMYVKANWTGEVILGRTPWETQSFLAARWFVKLDRYQRIWFTFYHDGKGKNFMLQIYNIPGDGTFSIGLFAIHKGTTPAPYTFPGGPLLKPYDYIPGIYYGDSYPITGTYKQGDIVYNTNPTAGKYVGWICVSGGSPGSWKSFGPISP